MDCALKKYFEQLLAVLHVDKKIKLHKNSSLYRLSMRHQFSWPRLQQLSNDRYPSHPPVCHTWLSCAHYSEPLPRSEPILALTFLFPPKDS